MRGDSGTRVWLAIHSFDDGDENLWVVVHRLACSDRMREETHDDTFEKLDSIAEFGRLWHEVWTSFEVRDGPRGQTIIAEHLFTKVVVRRLIEEHFGVVVTLET